MKAVTDNNGQSAAAESTAAVSAPAAEEIPAEEAPAKQADASAEQKAVKSKKARFFKNDFFADNVLIMIFNISLVIDSIILRAFTVTFGDSKHALTIIKNIIKPTLADIAAVTVISVFAYLFKKHKSRFIYLMVWTVVFSIFAIGNSIYYTNFTSFVSVSELSTASQLGGVMDAVTKNILEAKDFILIFPIPAMIIAYILLKKKRGKQFVKEKTAGKTRAKYAGRSLIATLCSAVLFATMLTKTDCSRLIKQWNRESIMSSFGMYVYQISDTISSVHAKLNVMFGYEKGRKKFDEFFDSKADTDSKVQVVSNESQTGGNEYTDIFKGKNVIAIHAESIQQFTLDTYFGGQPLTPNLDRLASEGLYFSNFYAQESVGTSSDSEFTFSSSLMPASSGTVAINYWDRNYVTTQKKFGEMGYYVFSMHGNNGSYWNRLNLHRSLGYDRLYNYSEDFDIDETIGLGLSDKSFFRQAVPKIKDISETYDNFYGTLIMLTNHTPFTDIERVSDYEVDFKFKRYDDETGMYEEVDRDFLEGTKLGSYFKSVHYADEALGQLMDDLDKEGLLDNTVVVIYGDHDAKIKEEEYEYYYNYDPFNDKTLTKDDDGYIPVNDFYYNINRRVPLIIWSKDGGYEPKEITKVMGMYDVQPTLGNMFGFTNKYALGHDIFSIADEDENVVIFPTGNFVTDKVYYESQIDSYFDLEGYENVAKYASCNQEFKDDPVPMYTEEEYGLYKFGESDYSQNNADMRINDGVVDSDYISAHCDYLAERIDVSNSIILYDIIHKVDEGFDSDLSSPPETPAVPDDGDKIFAPPEKIDRKRLITV